MSKACRKCQDMSSSFIEVATLGALASGSGSIECPKCRGDGNLRDGRLCHRCNGSGRVECPRCHGSGTLD
jgi:DnaJ-class molecular chaperone